MAEWTDLSLDSYRAARELLQTGRLRSCCSRLYYAVYAALTAKLEEAGVQFPHDGNNPSHEQLPKLVTHNLVKLPDHQRRRVAATVRRLRVSRVDADYIPTASLTTGDVQGLVRDTASVLRLLEVLDERTR